MQGLCPDKTAAQLNLGGLNSYNAGLMGFITGSAIDKGLSEIGEWSRRNQHALFKWPLLFMAVLALPRLAYQLWRLLLDRGKNGALDLRCFHDWPALWFQGGPVPEYNLLPATYPLLWPLTGWLSFESARWLWLLLYAAALIWLLRIIITEGGLRGSKEKLFATLFVLAIYPTGIIIGNGQMILLLLPCLLTAVLMGRDCKWTLGKEAAVFLLLTFSTLKLPVAAPFFMITLIVQRGYRPVIFTAAAYVLLTLFAVSFRDDGLVRNLELWMRDASLLATGGGYANIHIWLGYIGLGDWILPSSLALLAIFGLWLYRYRSADVWVHLGAAAIIARLWAYHRLYDDLLIIIPMVTVFRLLREGTLRGNEYRAACIILVFSWLGLLSPGFFLQLEYPIGTLFRAGQTVIWLSLLVFLLYYAHTSGRKAAV